MSAASKKKDPRLGPELFSEDENGEKRDSHLHDPILDGIHPHAHARLLHDTRKRARRSGMKKEHVEALYGKD
jgi:hypothetical protein